MLKIKDDVDLKDLEKFGFKYTERIYPMGDFSYCEKLIGKNVVLGVNADGREMLVTITGAPSSISYIFSDGLDVLFDLIQAGLAEKVEKEE